MNNFYFLLLLFSDFIEILFSFSFILDDEEAGDTAVTWHVTWCDVIGLKDSGRIYKMTSGHMLQHDDLEANMRKKHGHKGRVNY